MNDVDFVEFIGVWPQCPGRKLLECEGTAGARGVLFLSVGMTARLSGDTVSLCLV